MKYTNIIIAVVAVVIFALGGYWIGTRNSLNGSSSGGGGYSNTSQQGRVAGANQPRDHLEMVSDLRTRLKEAPDDWLLNAQLADALFGLRRFDEAITVYIKALELNPEDSNLYNNLGLAHHYIGDSAKGLEFVERGIAKNPYYQRVWLTKGFLLAYGLGKDKDAEAAWEKALSLDPEGPVGKAASEYLVEIKKNKGND